MSRAINLNLPEAEVKAECSKAGIGIASIEPLPGGGLHLVCATKDGADELRLRFEAVTISGPVSRYHHFLEDGPW